VARDPARLSAGRLDRGSAPPGSSQRSPMSQDQRGARSTEACPTDATVMWGRAPDAKSLAFPPPRGDASAGARSAGGNPVPHPGRKRPERGTAGPCTHRGLTGVAALPMSSLHPCLSAARQQPVGTGSQFFSTRGGCRLLEARTAQPS